jgi:hypothetical protein
MSYIKLDFKDLKEINDQIADELQSSRGLVEQDLEKKLAKQITLNASNAYYKMINEIIAGQKLITIAEIDDFLTKELFNGDQTEYDAQGNIVFKAIPPKSKIIEALNKFQATLEPGQRDSINRLKARLARAPQNLTREEFEGYMADDRTTVIMEERRNEQANDPDNKPGIDEGQIKLLTEKARQEGRQEAIQKQANEAEAKYIGQLYESAKKSMNKKTYGQLQKTITKELDGFILGLMTSRPIPDIIANRRENIKLILKNAIEEGYKTATTIQEEEIQEGEKKRALLATSGREKPISSKKGKDDDPTYTKFIKDMDKKIKTVQNNLLGELSESPEQLQRGTDVSPSEIGAQANPEQNPYGVPLPAPGGAAAAAVAVAGPEPESIPEPEPEPEPESPMPPQQSIEDIMRGYFGKGQKKHGGAMYFNMTRPTNRNAPSINIDNERYKYKGYKKYYVMPGINDTEGRIDNQLNSFHTDRSGTTSVSRVQTAPTLFPSQFGQPLQAPQVPTSQPQQPLAQPPVGKPVPQQPAVPTQPKPAPAPKPAPTAQPTEEERLRVQHINMLSALMDYDSSNATPQQKRAYFNTNYPKWQRALNDYADAFMERVGIDQEQTFRALNQTFQRDFAQHSSTRMYKYIMNHPSTRFGFVGSMIMFAMEMYPAQPTPAPAPAQPKPAQPTPAQPTPAPNPVEKEDTTELHPSASKNIVELIDELGLPKLVRPTLPRANQNTPRESSYPNELDVQGSSALIIAKKLDGYIKSAVSNNATSTFASKAINTVNHFIQAYNITGNNGTIWLTHLDLILASLRKLLSKIYDNAKSGEVPTKRARPGQTAGKGAVLTTIPEAVERLELLIGNIEAGNTSDEVSNEASRLLDFLFKKGKITKRSHKLMSKELNLI